MDININIFIKFNYNGNSIMMQFKRNDKFRIYT